MNGNSNASDQRSGQPLVWALVGHRTGDNLQVEALADALGWPVERKTLTWRKRLVGWTPRFLSVDIADRVYELANGRVVSTDRNRAQPSRTM